MDRINTPNIILKNGKRLFKDGDPSGDIPEYPTTVNAEWLNGVQEELLSLIESEGLVPNPKKNIQLKDSISKKLGNSEKILRGIIESGHASFNDSLKQLNSKISNLKVNVNTHKTQLEASNKRIETLKKQIVGLKNSLIGNVGANREQLNIVNENLIGQINHVNEDLIGQIYNVHTALTADLQGVSKQLNRVYISNPTHLHSTLESFGVPITHLKSYHNFRRRYKINVYHTLIKNNVNFAISGEDTGEVRGGMPKPNELLFHVLRAHFKCQELGLPEPKYPNVTIGCGVKVIPGGLMVTGVVLRPTIRPSFSFSGCYKV